MAVQLIGIGTAVPECALAQSQVRDLFLAEPDLAPLTARLIRAAYDNSAIERRHTVIEDFAGGGGTFLDPESRVIRAPGTATRNELYAREAPKLSETAARRALHNAGVQPSEITHVVTASCTGFYAPGPEYRLVRDLGLDPTVEREHIGFMGCAAAIPALRSAWRICLSDPTATVLASCTEVCSIHMRSSPDPDQIVASAVFADGAAAAIVTARTPEPGGGPAPSRSLELTGFATTLTTDGEKDMAWIIGDHGFEMTLTGNVPRIVGREVRETLAPVIDRVGAIDQWVVHPGGRSILDKFEQAMELDESALHRSRSILRDYGNMSSATVLFILADLLGDPTAATGERVLVTAFGPGLAVESATAVIAAPQPDASVPSTIERAEHSARS
jgi:predicted naringenin-chalcone synthase